LSDDETRSVARLLALNLERAATQAANELSADEEADETDGKF
jgi:hypothetical protein